jgi:hypothetical protein
VPLTACARQLTAPLGGPSAVCVYLCKVVSLTPCLCDYVRVRAIVGVYVCACVFACACVFCLPFVFSFVYDPMLVSVCPCLCPCPCL